MSVVFTATVGGKSYGFDFADQRIDVDATVNSMLVTDLYSAIKQAQSSTEGMAYNIIAEGSGRNILGAGVETYLTVTLLDIWEVLTLKASGKFEVFGGNLIRDDQGNPFRDNALITYISFMSQAGIATQVETGVSGLTTEESNQLSDIYSGNAPLVNAVFNTLIDGLVSFKTAMKKMFAVISGPATFTTPAPGESTIEFKNQAGTTDGTHHTTPSGRTVT